MNTKFADGDVSADFVIKEKPDTINSGILSTKDRLLKQTIIKT